MSHLPVWDRCHSRSALARRRRSEHWANSIRDDGVRPRNRHAARVLQSLRHECAGSRKLKQDRWHGWADLQPTLSEHQKLVCPPRHNVLHFVNEGKRKDVHEARPPSLATQCTSPLENASDQLAEFAVVTDTPNCTCTHTHTCYQAVTYLPTLVRQLEFHIAITAF